MQCIDVRLLARTGHSTPDAEKSASSQEQTYNLANFLRTLALPDEVEHWSLTTLRDKLIKIGAKVVRHGRYITLSLIDRRVASSSS